MANYKKDNSKQNMFVPIMIDEQLIPGTIEYAIAHIVDNYLDLSSFDDAFSNDNGGATAYPPSIMLKIIFYAYSLGLLSSRRIAPLAKQILPSCAYLETFNLTTRRLLHSSPT